MPLNRSLYCKLRLARSPADQRAVIVSLQSSVRLERCYDLFSRGPLDAVHSAGHCRRMWEAHPSTCPVRLDSSIYFGRWSRSIPNSAIWRKNSWPPATWYGTSAPMLAYSPSPPRTWLERAVRYMHSSLTFGSFSCCGIRRRFNPHRPHRSRSSLLLLRIPAIYEHSILRFDLAPPIHLRDTASVKPAGSPNGKP